MNPLLLFNASKLPPYGVIRNGLIAINDPWRDTYGRNILPVGSENFVTGWEKYGGETITVTDYPTTINGQAVIAKRIQGTGNGSTLSKYAIGIVNRPAPNVDTCVLYAKLLSGNAGITNTSGVNPQTVTAEWQKIKITQGLGDSTTALKIRTLVTTDTLDIVVYQPQVNISTLYPYSPPAGLPQSLTDYTGRGNNAQLGSAAGADTNDPKYNGVALVGDGVDDYAVVPLASAAYRISIVDSGSGYTFVNEVPAYLNLFKTGASTYLNGKIGPTAYYNRVLTAGEIAQAKAGLKRYMASKGVTVS